MAGKIEIQKISIVDLDTDAIVNAANEALREGSGVCGAIFAAAGSRELQKACDVYGYCPTGDAVITPGFRLKSKYVIHAVGPMYHDGKHGEKEMLKSAYKKSLKLAVENGCHSIGFPLISAGIFGYPVEDAWKDAFSACFEFLSESPDCDLKIVFAVLNDRMLAQGRGYLYQCENESAPQAKPHQKRTFVDKLTIGSAAFDAIYFHKPDEPNGYLSNWYRSPFDLDGVHYTSVEQYIMFQKCKLFGDEAAAEAVLSTDDVAAQQAIGRSANGYIGTVWAGMRQLVALKGLLAKFSQNEDLKQKLLDTGDAYLVECARMDKVWACGIRLTDDRRFDASNWDGENILGFALMEVRNTLRGE